ncbi:MAG: LEPR-XLL domain-containing protein [Planctomycetaceae bacterium]
MSVEAQLEPRLLLSAAVGDVSEAVAVAVSQNSTMSVPATIIDGTRQVDGTIRVSSPRTKHSAAVFVPDGQKTAPGSGDAVNGEDSPSPPIGRDRVLTLQISGSLPAGQRLVIDLSGGQITVHFAVNSSGGSVPLPNGDAGHSLPITLPNITLKLPGFESSLPTQPTVKSTKDLVSPTDPLRREADRVVVADSTNAAALSATGRPQPRLNGGAADEGPDASSGAGAHGADGDTTSPAPAEFPLNDGPGLVPLAAELAIRPTPLNNPLAVGVSSANGLLTIVLPTSNSSLAAHSGNRSPADGYEAAGASVEAWLTTRATNEILESPVPAGDLSEAHEQFAEPSDSNSGPRELHREQHAMARLEVSIGGDPTLLLLSDQPPEPPEISGIWQQLKFDCNPRGPPVSDSLSGSEFGRTDAMSGQLRRLRHSIAPRGPSVTSNR